MAMEPTNSNFAAARMGHADAKAEAAEVVRGLVAILRESITWVAKLAADAPEGLVGRGPILRRSLRRIELAIERGEAYLEEANPHA